MSSDPDQRLRNHAMCHRLDPMRLALTLATLAGLLALAAPSSAATGRDRNGSIEAASIDRTPAGRSDSAERISQVAAPRAVRVAFALRVHGSFALAPARVLRAPRRLASPRRRCPRLRVDSPPDH